MKIVVLVDSDIKNFEQMLEQLKDIKVFVVDTGNCDREHEYKYLSSSIREFSDSENEIMLVKFSGRESMLRELGDEFSEMIIAISSRKNSRHYIPQPVMAFSDVMNIFKEEGVATTSR